MKKFNIYNTSLSMNSFCCQIEARDKKSALRKYRKELTSSGIYWFEEDKLLSSFGGCWKAQETI